MSWIKTDDMQYVSKVDDGVYKIVEARYAEDKYIVCGGEIKIANWLDSDGNYDADCKDIITAFYNSVDEFLERYGDNEEREQVLAEMLFEETHYWDTDRYELVAMDAVEEKLTEYLNVFYTEAGITLASYFQTNTHTFRRLEETEVRQLKVGDKVAIGINFTHPRATEFVNAVVVRPVFWNSDADEPDWEIETTNGFVDLYSLYEVNKI